MDDHSTCTQEHSIISQVQAIFLDELFFVIVLGDKRTTLSTFGITINTPIQ